MRSRSVNFLLAFGPKADLAAEDEHEKEARMWRKIVRRLEKNADWQVYQDQEATLDRLQIRLVELGPQLSSLHLDAINLEVETIPSLAAHLKSLRLLVIGGTASSGQLSAWQKHVAAAILFVPDSFSNEDHLEFWPRFYGALAAGESLAQAYSLSLALMRLRGGGNLPVKPLQSDQELLKGGLWVSVEAQTLLKQGLSITASSPIPPLEPEDSAEPLPPPKPPNWLDKLSKWFSRSPKESRSIPAPVPRKKRSKKKQDENPSRDGLEEFEWAGEEDAVTGAGTDDRRDHYELPTDWEEEAMTGAEPPDMAAPPEPIEEEMEAAEEEEPVEESASAPPPSPSPQPASTRATGASKSEAELVDLSVYAPEQVRKGSRFILTAFAHLDTQAEAVEALMREADPAAVRQGGKTLNMPLQHGDSIQLRLNIEDWEVDEAVQDLYWYGRPNSAEFVVKVPESYDRPEAIGSLVVLYQEQALPIGRIKFNLMVLGPEAAAEAADHSMAPTEGISYRSAYLAYTPEDEALASPWRDKLQQSGYTQVFVSPADPGDEWEIEAVEGIRQAEVVVLGWSAAAEASDRFAIEWEHALGLRYAQSMALPDIIPLALRQPTPALPQELALFPLSDQTAKPRASLPMDWVHLPLDEFKQACEQGLAQRSAQVFDHLLARLEADQENRNTVLGLKGEWHAVKRKLRLYQLSEEEANRFLTRVVHATLSVVREMS